MVGADSQKAGAVAMVCFGALLLCSLAAAENRHSEQRHSPQTYYVDQSHPLASDGNPGTQEAPFLTIQRGVDALLPGDLLLIKEGVYTTNSTHHATPVMEVYRSGDPNDPITIRAFEEDHVVLDAQLGHFQAGWVYADNIEIEGLTFVNARRRGLLIEDAAHVVVRNCVAHHNAGDGIGVDGGFQIHGNARHCVLDSCQSYANGTGFTFGYRDAPVHPRYCEARFCVAHDNNVDEEDSDGFALIQTVGCALRYCVAYRNADDGINTQGPDCDDTLFEYCLAFRNDPAGTEAGDGNGFKLSAGGNSRGAVVRHCVSFLNASRGFDDGYSEESLYYHNVAVANGRWGFLFEGTRATAYNNIAQGNYADNPSQTAPRDVKSTGAGQGTTVSDYNFWADGRFIAGEGPHTLSGDAGFLDLASIKDFVVTGPGPVDVPGLHLSSDSQAVDAGVDLGWPYYGHAPDMGAYEYPGNE